MSALFIGVDGGATKVVVRVEDEHGSLLGVETGGPANIRISVAQAWDSINAALEKILRPLNLSGQHDLHAGMGLAGSEIDEARQAFLNQPHAFRTLTISSDAHTACLGAHNGADGAVIMLGTGVVGYAIRAGKHAKVGGWGFPHDDIGGGAWLGLEAVKLTLQWLDGRAAESGLTDAVFRHFDSNRKQLVAWACQANSSAFATLAPLVVKQGQAGDEAATGLLKQSAHEVERIAAALENKCMNAGLQCVLSGSIAPFIQSFIDSSLAKRLTPAISTPDAGAILLARVGTLSE